MDPTQIKKFQAMKRYKMRQFLDNFYFCFLSVLTCSLFCCVTLCLPSLSSLFMLHMSSLITVLLSSKLLFVIGNLIVFFLVVNSRILSSDSSSTCVVYYDEYIQSSQTMKPQIPGPDQVVNEGKTLEKHVGENVDMNSWVEKATEASKEEENIHEGVQQCLIPSSDDDELNKRADDFIARVNKQRRLELSLLHYYDTN